MRYSLAVWLSVAVLSCLLGAVDAATIAFERDGWVWVAKEDGTKARKVARGVYPNISPDGAMLVYNTESGDFKNTDRQIMLADLATDKAMPIPNIPSKNCFGPVWTPDGKQVIFQMMRSSSWELGLIDANGDNFRALSFKLPGNEEPWQPTWAADGKSLFCHDLMTVYQVTLEGRVLKKWPVTLFSKEGGLNSGSSLATSPDGRYLLVEVDMNEETQVKGWDGPPPALFRLELGSDKIAKVTPPGLLTWSGCWLGNGVVLCQGVTVKKPKPSIYQISLTDGTARLLIPEGRSPSASR